MSFDIFFQRFDDTGAEAEAVMAVLEPFISERGDGFVQVAVGDGGADVYISDPSRGAMVNHASGTAVWNLMYDLAVAGRFAIVPVGCGTCVPDAGMADEVRDYAPQPITVVRSGTELLQVVESS